MKNLIDFQNYLTRKGYSYSNVQFVNCVGFYAKVKNPRIQDFSVVYPKKFVNEQQVLLTLGDSTNELIIGDDFDWSFFGEEVIEYASYCGFEIKVSRFQDKFYAVANTGEPFTNQPCLFDDSEEALESLRADLNKYLTDCEA